MTAPACRHQSWRTLVTPKKRSIVGHWCEKRKGFVNPAICPMCKHRGKIRPAAVPGDGREI